MSLLENQKLLDFGIRGCSAKTVAVLFKNPIL